MKSKLSDVGPLELKVLGALNAGDSFSVAAVQAQLKKDGHDLAYTTIMTVLVRLFQKDLVTREKAGRQFLYSVATKKNVSPLRLLERMKTSLFGNEKLRPILGLLESDDSLSKEDLQALKKVVDARLKEKGARK